MKKQNFIYFKEGEHKGKVALLDTFLGGSFYIVYFDCLFGDEHDVVERKDWVFAEANHIREYKKQDPVRSSLLGL